MTKKIEEKEIPKNPLSFWIEMSKPHAVPALTAIFFVVIGTTLNAITPYFFKEIVDAIANVSSEGFGGLWFWSGLYVGVGFLGILSWRVSNFVGLRYVTSIRATTRSVLSAYITKHSHGYFSDRFAGSIGGKIANATSGMRSMSNNFLWGWLDFVLSLLISLGLVFYTNVYIGIIFFCWLLIVTPLNIFLVRKKVPFGIAAQQRETELRGQTVDILTNVDAMHDYARRTFELKKLEELIQIRRLAGKKNWIFSEKILLANNFLETAFIGGMIFLTVYFFTLGKITAGDIVLVLALVVSVRGSLAHIGDRFNDFADVWSEVKEGLDEILNPHEIVDAPLATQIKVPNGEITFENVSFTYETQKVLKSLNLSILRGQRVGLVGRSGAGKSTLMKLLTRQHDIDSGEILIDGQNIALVKQESLRSAISVVPQDPLLFHRSLKENIRYGRPTATDEEIIKYAKFAQAHDFINRLPGKYETLVGERGIKLSGGERQRVAIARAFLKDAKVLLLDEATSSLDSESELAIQKALEKLMEGKTVIAIAHRLSTLRAMDRIIVLDQGQIIEDGTHEELLKIGGVYAELWSHQAGGFIQEE